MILRNTKIEDYDGIYELLNASDMVFYSFSREKFKKMLNKNKGCYFVAIDKNKIVGNIFAAHDGGYFGYIYKLAVLKHHRKDGIATALIEKVLGRFKEVKVRWVFCHIRKKNKISINLFKKFGFKDRKIHSLFDIYSVKK